MTTGTVIVQSLFRRQPETRDTWHFTRWFLPLQVSARRFDSTPAAAHVLSLLDRHISTCLDLSSLVCNWKHPVDFSVRFNFRVTKPLVSPQSTNIKLLTIFRSKGGDWIISHGFFDPHRARFARLTLTFFHISSWRSFIFARFATIYPASTSRL